MTDRGARQPDDSQTAAMGHRMGARPGPETGPEPEPHVRNINQNHIGTAQNEESKQKLRTQSALEKRH